MTKGRRGTSVQRKTPTKKPVVVEQRPRRAPMKAPPPQRAKWGPMGMSTVTAPGSGYGVSGLAEMAGRAVGGFTSDAHLRYELDELVAQSQKLARVDTLYRSLIFRLVDLIVGEGWAIQPKSDNDRWNADTKRRFESWWLDKPEIRGTVDGPELQRRILYHVLVDGRMLLNRVGSEQQVQLIAGDQIWSSRQGYGSGIEFGVQLDKFGRHVRFHIAQPTAWGMGRKDGPTIPVENSHYWAQTTRIDETAGPPPLYPIFEHLTRLSDIFDAEACKWQIVSRIALKITKENAATAATATSQLDPQNDPARPNITDRVQQLPFAIIFHGEQGDNIEGVEGVEPGGGSFEDSVKVFLRLCAVELGLSLPFWWQDWGDVNFSSGRAAARQFWRNSATYMRGMHEALSQIYKWFVEEEIRRGNITARDDWDVHEWVPEPFEPMDPQKENQADAEAIRAGLKTQARARAERGIDHDSENAARATELSKAAELVAAHNAKYPDSKITIAAFLGEGNYMAGGAPAAAPADPKQPPEDNSAEPADLPADGEDVPE